MKSRSKEWQISVAIAVKTLVFLIICAATVYAQNDTLKQNNYPKLVLFLIHGLGGDDIGTFCDLEKIIESEFNNEIDAVSLKYDTYNQKLKHIDFAKSIHSQIIKYYSAQKIDSKTPFGFVTHSQGGIIAIRYVDLCLNHDKCSQPDISAFEKPKNLKLFVTFGTPFWGSPVAARLTAANLGKRFGAAEQIEHLATSSLTINNMRSVFMQKIDEPKNIFPPNTTIVNIAGEASSFITTNLLGKLLFNSKGLTESDLVVTNAAARLDFHYYDEDFLGNIRTGQTRMAETYYVVDWPHTQIRNGKTGLACVLDGIKINTKYNYRHFPPYKALHNTLVREVGQDNYLPIFESDYLEGLRKFLVEIRLQFQPGYERIVKNKKFDIKAVKNLNKVDYDSTGIYASAQDAHYFEKVVTNNTLINISHGLNNDQNQYLSKKYLSAFHEGQLDKKITYSKIGNPPTHNIDYKINIPGFIPRLITLSVSPAQSTYSRINLIPYLPLNADRSIECPDSECAMQCYVARIARMPSKDKIQIFNDANQTQVRAELHPETPIKVFRRVGLGLRYSTPPELYETDSLYIEYPSVSALRKFKSLAPKSRGWVKTNEIDFLKPCSR